MKNEELEQSKNKINIIIGMLKNSDGILERQNLIYVRAFHGGRV